MYLDRVRPNSWSDILPALTDEAFKVALMRLWVVDASLRSLCCVLLDVACDIPPHLVTVCPTAVEITFLAAFMSALFVYLHDIQQEIAWLLRFVLFV